MCPHGKPFVLTTVKVVVVFVFGDGGGAEIALGVPDAIGGELAVGGVGSHHSSVGVDVNFRRWGAFHRRKVYYVLGDIVDAACGLKQLSGIGVGGEQVVSTTAVVVVGHVVDELLNLVGLQESRGSIIPKAKDGTLWLLDAAWLGGVRSVRRVARSFSGKRGSTLRCFTLLLFRIEITSKGVALIKIR